MTTNKTFTKKTWVSAEGLIDAICWGRPPLSKEQEKVLSDYGSRKIGAEECCRLLGFKKYNYFMTTSQEEITGNVLKEAILREIRTNNLIKNPISIDYLIEMLPASRENIRFHLGELEHAGKIKFLAGFKLECMI